MPKVSIVVPIYNVGKYLKKCVESIINQTLKDIEIICVNDGSTDGSLDILKEFAAKDKRVIIIDKENSGYGHSMNVGIDRAKGEYIGIVESDDFVAEEMYELLYNKAKEFDVDFVKSNYYKYSSAPVEKKVEFSLIEDSGYFNKVISDFNNKVFLKGDLAHWSGIYKKKFLEGAKIRFLETPGASYQDAGFYLKVFIAADCGYFVENNLYFYRQDNESSSVNDFGKVFCLCGEYESIEKYLAQRPEKKHFERAVQYKKFAAYMWNYKRIAPEFKITFISRMSKEFQIALKQGKLDKKWFSNREWDKLQLIIRFPFMFLLKYKNNIRVKKNKEKKIMDFEEFFEKVKAQKQIDKLAKKYKNKKVVLYGAGKYSRELFEEYDLSKLNIVAIADKSFEKQENRNFYELNCVAPDDLRQLDYDVILLTVYDEALITDFLKEELLVASKNEKVKIKPLVKPSFWLFLSELF